MNENIDNPDYKIITPFKGWVLENFPFIEADFDAITNYQLISKVVEYLNQVISNENLTEQKMLELITAYNNLKDYVDNYFANLNVQEEINNKLDTMALDGTLTSLISAYVDPIYEAYETEINATISNQNTVIGNQQDAIDTLESRMDAFASLTDGSTTGDAELQDIRVAIGGATYSTAGNSVRGQALYNEEKAQQLSDKLGYSLYSNFDIQNGKLTSTGNADYVRITNYFPITPQSKINIDINKVLAEGIVWKFDIQYYREDKTSYNIITNITSLPITTPTSETVKYARIDFTKYDTINETNVSVRKTDFVPTDVIINIENKTTIDTNLKALEDNKYNCDLIARQVYLALPNTLFCEKGTNNEFYIKWDNYLLNRVVFAGDFTTAQIITSAGDTYSGTSPSGITDCIKIPSGYNLVYDTTDSSQRFKVISRDDSKDRNKYISYMEVVSGNVVGGILKPMIDEYFMKQYADILASDNIPAYWRSTISTKETTVRTNLATYSNLYSFFFITDQHWTSNAKKSSDIIKKMGRELNIPLVLSGGDIINGGNEHGVAGINELENYIATLNDGFLKVISTYGNHDYNNNNNAAHDRLDENQQYNALMRNIAFNYKANCYNKKVMYFDDESAHVRIISYKCSYSRSESYDSSIISTITSLVNELDSSWNIIFLCHVYCGDGQSSYNTVAYQYADEIAGLSHTAEATIVCQFTGHVHADHDTTITNANGGELVVISGYTDSIGQNTAVGESAQHTMTSGTDTEQAFDIVQIDLTNRNIYMTRVGAGDNRTITY